MVAGNFLVRVNWISVHGKRAQCEPELAQNTFDAVLLFGAGQNFLGVKKTFAGIGACGQLDCIKAVLR